MEDNETIVEQIEVKATTGEPKKEKYKMSKKEKIGYLIMIIWTLAVLTIWILNVLKII